MSARVLALYWIVFLIVSFVPRSKENRLCLKSIESANDPWSTTATPGVPGQQIKRRRGRPLCPAVITSVNIFLKGDKVGILCIHCQFEKKKKKELIESFLNSPLFRMGLFLSLLMNQWMSQHSTHSSTLLGPQYWIGVPNKVAGWGRHNQGLMRTWLIEINFKMIEMWLYSRRGDSFGLQMLSFGFLHKFVLRTTWLRWSHRMKQKKKLNQEEPQITCQRPVYRIVRITQTLYPRSSLVYKYLSKRYFSMSLHAFLSVLSTVAPWRDLQNTTWYNYSIQSVQSYIGKPNEKPSPAFL